MKKRMCTFISLTLVIMLVASMTLPAMAVSGITPSGYVYQYFVTRTDTTGKSEVAITSAAPAYVTAQVKNIVYNELNEMWIYPEDRNTGYIRVSATAGNVVKKDGYLFDGIVRATIGDCWVAGTQVAVGVFGKYVG